MLDGSDAPVAMPPKSDVLELNEEAELDIETFPLPFHEVEDTSAATESTDVVFKIRPNVDDDETAVTVTSSVDISVAVVVFHN